MSDFTITAGDLVFYDFRIATMAPGTIPYGLIEAGMLVVRGDRIAHVSSSPAFDSPPAGSVIIRGNGQLITPGLIDCHTHLVFAGDRSREFGRRMQGTSYEAIAREGGGILATVRATRDAPHESLLFDGQHRLAIWLHQGVTTIEIKSGYGLDLETERKQLLVANDLGQHSPVEVVATLLAAHVNSPEFAGRADEYIEFVCGEVIPSTSDLASAVDVFCEGIAFSVSQSQRVLEAGLRHGLHAKIHAEQFTNIGGAAMAAEHNAISADHLEYLDEAAVRTMADHQTVATLLPGAYYFLNLKQPPPVEMLRQHGVPMAVATDFNPGSSPISSVFWTMNLACLLFGMTPEEAIRGMTCHAARALRIEDRVGTIEVGKQADLALWNVNSPEALVCALIDNPCKAVYKRGELAYAASM